MDEHPGMVLISPTAAEEGPRNQKSDEHEPNQRGNDGDQDVQKQTIVGLTVRSVGEPHHKEARKNERTDPLPGCHSGKNTTGKRVNIAPGKSSGTVCIKAPQAAHATS